MKYIIVLGDGMADYPVPELNNKTPLEAANIPNIDWLAQHGETGLVQSVPAGMAPGSDVANLGVMGYNPSRYYTGRSPLEAVSMGISLGDHDVAYRCNLVTVSDEENLDDQTMIDYSAGEISTEEAAELISALNAQIDFSPGELYAGIGYRHCFVLRNGKAGGVLVPPHDIMGKGVADYLPKEQNCDFLRDLMIKSQKILREHPINIKRIAEGKSPANSCWFWGEGTLPALTKFRELYGCDGAVISAVDLLKGIAICADLKAPNVEGATGTMDTNYENKLETALEILEHDDFVYMHFEGPDECGHKGDGKDKVVSIERIDQRVVKPLLERLNAKGWDYNILLMPDHATPVVLRTHTCDPVPYILYKKNQEIGPHAQAYTEVDAKATGKFMSSAHDLVPRLFNFVE